MRPLSFLSFKTLALAGIAAATLGTGAVAASAATTEDDSNFGQQVREQVATCKATAARTDASGARTDHGIGGCVSAWVVSHNPGHTATAARTESTTEDSKESAQAASKENENEAEAPKAPKAPHGKKGR